MSEIISSEVREKIGDGAEGLREKLKGLTNFKREKDGEASVTVEPMAGAVVSGAAPKEGVATAPAEAPVSKLTSEAAAEQAVKVEVGEKKPKTVEDVLVEFEVARFGTLREEAEKAGLRSIVQEKVRIVKEAGSLGVEGWGIKGKNEALSSRIDVLTKKIEGAKKASDAYTDDVPKEIIKDTGARIAGWQGELEEARGQLEKAQELKEKWDFQEEKRDLVVKQLKQEGIDLESKEGESYREQLQSCVDYLEQKKQIEEEIADREEDIGYWQKKVDSSRTRKQTKADARRNIRNLRAQIRSRRKKIESNAPKVLKGFEGEAKGEIETAFRQAVEGLKRVYEKPEEAVAVEPELTAVPEVVGGRQDELLTQAEEAVERGDAAGVARALMEAAGEGEFSDEQKERVAGLVDKDIEWNEEALKRDLEGKDLTDPKTLKFIAGRIEALREKGRKLSILNGLLIQLATLIIFEMSGQAGSEVQIASLLVDAEDVFIAAGRPVPKSLEAIEGKYKEEVEAGRAKKVAKKRSKEE